MSEHKSLQIIEETHPSLTPITEQQDTPKAVCEGNMVIHEVNKIISETERELDVILERVERFRGVKRA